MYFSIHFSNSAISLFSAPNAFTVDIEEIVDSLTLLPSASYPRNVSRRIPCQMPFRYISQFTFFWDIRAKFLRNLPYHLLRMVTVGMVMNASNDSCQLITNMNINVPTARTEDRRNTFTLDVMDELTRVVSLPNRLVMSPVRVVSKNPISVENRTI